MERGRLVRRVSQRGVAKGGERHQDVPRARRDGHAAAGGTKHDAGKAHEEGRGKHSGGTGNNALAIGLVVAVLVIGVGFFLRSKRS